MRGILRPQILSTGPKLQCEGTPSFFTAKKQLRTAQQYSTRSNLLLLNSTRNQLQSYQFSRNISRIQSPCLRRSFINLSNILPNNNNNRSNEAPRTLRATRSLPFPPSPLYEIIASVESYADFLPFLAASTVTARDPATGYPTQAFLTVGYGPFQETFTSRVTCDRTQWTVEARSGGGIGDDGKPVPGEDEGLFSHLSTQWKLVPRTQNGGAQVTDVELEIRFRFQNPMHTAMMGAVEDKVAAVMIEAFERRIREQMAQNR